MKMSAQTIMWFIFLALIKNYSCDMFKFPNLTLSATEGSCIEIECTVPQPDDLNRGYWFWMKNAVWNEKKKIFDATIVYSSDESKRTVDPVFASRVTKTPHKNPPSPQCSILICGLNKNDGGNYSVRYIGSDALGRTEIWKTPEEVNLTVTENPCPITFEKPPVVKESETITLTCSTLSSCSSDLLIKGKQFDSSSMERQEGETKKSTTVSFKASWEDDGKKFSCQTQNNQDKYLIKEETATVEYAPKEVKAEINRTDIQEGQSVTFTCSANGRPEPDITWFFNSDHKQSWSKQIESIQRSQSGEYHCVAQNKHGNQSSNKVTVNVQYVPEVEIKTDSCASPHCVLKEKDRIALTCVVINTNPNPDAYFWNKNGRMLSSEKQYVKVINPEDRGEYTCGAENTVGTGKSKPLNLEVEYAPRGTNISARETVKIGQTAVLTCDTDARPAPFSYTWNRYNDKQLTASSQWKNNTFTLQRVRREDDACYTCTAENKINTGQSSKMKCIRVLYPPTNLQLSMKTEAREGQLLIIRCSVESSPQSDLMIKMATEGHHLSEWTDPKSKIYQTASELQYIINVTSAHMGVYSCYAKNSEGSKESQQKKLVVKYRPKDVRVQAEPGLVVTENTSLTLSCRAQSHPPVTNFTWMKVNKERDEPTGTKTQTITVKSVSPSDSGLYRCAASNEMGTRSSQQVEVKVKYAPKHTDIQMVSTTSQQQPDGKTSVTLSCSSHSYPPPTYQWYKKTDEEEREVSKDQNITVYSDQPGIYSCIAKNEVNHRSSDPVELFVDNFPKALKLLIPFLIILLIIVLVFFILRHKRSKSPQQGTENTPPRSGRLCWGNYARRRSLINVPFMSEPSQSRDDLLPDQPCRPNPQHHQARPDSTPASNITSVYATVNVPAGKQAPSAPKPAGHRAGNTKDDSINYASLQFAKRPNDKQINVKEPDAVYAVVSKKKSLKKNDEEIQRMQDYENVTAALEAKSPDPLSSETSSTSSDSSDNEVELNYSQVSFKAKPGHRKPATDSSTSEDEEVTQYSQVKM